MYEVMTFTLSSIIYFINSLRDIKIPGTNLNLFTLLISVILIQIIYTFILSFFKIEKNQLKSNVYKGYFKRRKNLIKNMKDKNIV